MSELVALVPNPDEPELNKLEVRLFLLNVQKFDGVGPNYGRTPGSDYAPYSS